MYHLKSLCGSQVVHVLTLLRACILMNHPSEDGGCSAASSTGSPPTSVCTVLVRGAQLFSWDSSARKLFCRLCPYFLTCNSTHWLFGSQTMSAFTSHYYLLEIWSQLSGIPHFGQAGHLQFHPTFLWWHRCKCAWHILAMFYEKTPVLELPLKNVVSTMEHNSLDKWGWMGLWPLSF